MEQAPQGPISTAPTPKPVPPDRYTGIDMEDTPHHTHKLPFHRLHRPQPTHDHTAMPDTPTMVIDMATDHGLTALDQVLGEEEGLEADEGSGRLK